MWKDEDGSRVAKTNWRSAREGDAETSWPAAAAAAADAGEGCQIGSRMVGLVGRSTRVVRGRTVTLRVGVTGSKRAGTFWAFHWDRGRMTE